MAIQFFEVPIDATDFTSAFGRLDFTVIGSDQGLASSPTPVDTLLSEPGSRYDIIVDFGTVTPGRRVIMKNIGGDAPFGGDIPGPEDFECTDRIMAFDVILDLGELSDVENVSPADTDLGPDPFPVIPTPTRTRKVALFEGMDEFGRLQPLLGTAEPATDYQDPPQPINWPDLPVYSSVGLIGQMGGSIAWHSPTTENPSLGSTEEWEIYNVTGDAHPVHLHLVHFEIIGRDEIKWDKNADDDGFLPDNDPSNAFGDGTYVLPQPTVQHNSVAGDPATYGQGFKIVNAIKGDPTAPPQVPDAYVENAPKDMVTALPGQVTRIKMTFDKPGRYVWHCHILSHEDHEMMRVLHVGPGAHSNGHGA